MTRGTCRHARRRRALPPPSEAATQPERIPHNASRRDGTGRARWALPPPGEAASPGAVAAWPTASATPGPRQWASPPLAEAASSWRAGWPTASAARGPRRGPGRYCCWRHLLFCMRGNTDFVTDGADSHTNFAHSDDSKIDADSLLLLVLLESCAATGSLLQT